MAFALSELYKTRTPENVLTLKAYEQLGGVAGVLGKRADETYAALFLLLKLLLERCSRSWWKWIRNAVCRLANVRRCSILITMRRCPGLD